MKKGLILLIVSVLLFAGCETLPKPPPEPQPVTQEPAPVVQTQPEPPPPVQEDGNRHATGVLLDGASVYTVQSGDTLSGIARRFYRDGAYYPLIMMVSGEVKDIDVIEPGMSLTVPDLQRNMSDTRAKAAISSYFSGIAAIEDMRGRKETAALILNRAK
jgi:hypothetical protein